MILPLISEHSLGKAKMFVILWEKPHKDHFLDLSYFCNPLVKMYFPMIWPGCLLFILEDRAFPYNFLPSIIIFKFPR